MGITLQVCKQCENQQITQTLVTLQTPVKAQQVDKFHHPPLVGQVKVQFQKQGIKYKGQLVNGKAHGHGVLENKKQKYKFVGEWEQSIPIKGILTFTQDPNIKDIQLVDRYKNLIKINYKDLRIYQGCANIINFLPQGEGKITFPKQSKKKYYQGQFKKGLFWGRGVFQWKDGSKYEGYFVQGKKQGFGVYQFSDGGIFKGFWSRGKQDGQGVLQTIDKKITKGIWQNSKFQHATPNQQIIAALWVDSKCYYYKNILLDSINIGNISVSDQSYIFGSTKISKKYQIKIHNRRNAIKGIGVVDSSYRKQKVFWNLPNIIWFQNLGFCQISNKVQQASIRGYEQGQSITMRVNLQQGTIQWKKFALIQKISFAPLKNTKINWVPLLIICCYQTATLKYQLFQT